MSLYTWTRSADDKNPLFISPPPVNLTSESETVRLSTLISSFPIINWAFNTSSNLLMIIFIHQSRLEHNWHSLLPTGSDVLIFLPLKIRKGCSLGGGFFSPSQMTTHYREPETLQKPPQNVFFCPFPTRISSLFISTWIPLHVAKGCVVYDPLCSSLLHTTCRTSSTLWYSNHLCVLSKYHGIRNRNCPGRFHSSMVKIDGNDIRRSGNTRNSY